MRFCVITGVISRNQSQIIANNISEREFGCSCQAVRLEGEIGSAVAIYLVAVWGARRLQRLSVLLVLLMFLAAMTSMFILPLHSEFIVVVPWVRDSGPRGSPKGLQFFYTL